jgi:tetratricopeptide (TPR) repeat protein
MQTPPPPPAFRLSLGWTAALLVALALGCYWPALHGALLWDDDAHVTRPALQSLAGLGRIWTDLHATQQYYPVLHSAFWIEHRGWGDATLGYHLANLFEHALAAFLLVLLLRRLKVPGAELAGLLFVAHPVCVESVAWISEQKNTLSLVFYLLSALAYLRFVRDDRRPAGAYALAFVLFLVALLTKSVTATLPATLLVVLWWQHGRLSARRDVLPLLPWFAVAAASGLCTAWVERTVIGAQGAAFTLTLAQRGLLAGRIVWFYLGKLLWPARLMFIYPRWEVRAAGPGWWGYLAAALLLTAGLWRLRRRGRGPLAAWLGFVGALFPALGFVNVYPFIYSYVADHFQYLACLAIISAAAAGLARGAGRLSARLRPIGGGLAAAVVATLAFLSHAQSRMYADLPTLYRSTLARNPQAWMAHLNLGLWYSDHGDLTQAIAHYQTALRLEPESAEAHSDLGAAWLKTPGRLRDAMAEDQAALRLWPDFPGAHTNLGNAWAKVPGHLHDALAEYATALRLKPEYAEAWNNQGLALVRAGRIAAALESYRQALRLDPRLVDADNNLGVALALTRRPAEAMAHFQAAVRLRPDFADAQANLGLVLANLGRLAEAVPHYEQALAARPGSAEVHYNLALALGGLGRKPEALAHLEQAVRLQPDFVAARDNLGIALAELGRWPEAIFQFETALRSQPDDPATHRDLGVADRAIGRIGAAAAQFELAKELAAKPGARP